MKPSKCSVPAQKNDNMTTGWKFGDILSYPAVRDRWEKVRKFFFLRESTYDMTRRCNIRCDGCYFYEGDKQFTEQNRDPHSWHELMKREKDRGITYVVLAGAEPSLVPELLTVCYDVLPLGAIATNGLKAIPENIGYRVHISVWGNDHTSRRVRHAEDMLTIQMDNYQNDSRAVFVYTFTRENIEEADGVVEMLSRRDFRTTFNMFSAPEGYRGPLRHNAGSLRKTRAKMNDLLCAYPDHVLYSPYSVVAHTHRLGLHALFSCPYPRRNPSKDVGLGRSFRQYRTDLTWDRQAACCVPDTDCDDCRHYAAGSAIVTARLFRHADNPEVFSSWLDYVDTYLSVWVTGYAKGSNLCTEPAAPPGHTHQ
jgi:MoaA/NifB/PqqE/SkfB family radical SAM enzyme